MRHVNNSRDALNLLRASLLSVCLSALGGCVSYDAAPLPLAPKLAPSLTRLVGAPSRITLPVLDRLVLDNNPDLVAARTRLGISRAQVVQAGLLPNPQFVASYPFYISGPGGSDGFTLGLAQDLRSLLLRPTKREVATNAALAVNASLLWQEWQTIGKARLLFVDIAAGERASRLIERNKKLLQERFDLANAKLRLGAGPLSDLAPDLASLGEVQKLADDLARLQLGRRQQFAALLGLSPDASLKLAPSPVDLSLDASRADSKITDLANRRPDLVALQYGYRSEDARLRQAVLSQFPNIAFSVLGGRDTSKVYSTGPQVSFDLPIFDRGQASIAIEQASRDELRREFEARLAQAAGDIRALAAQQSMLRRQLAALVPRLKQSREIAVKTEEAFKASAIDERSYVDVEVTVLSQEQQQNALEQALLEGQVGLATLTGAGMPSIAIAPEPPHADPLGLLRAFSR